VIKLSAEAEFRTEISHEDEGFNHLAAFTQGRKTPAKLT